VISRSKSPYDWTAEPPGLCGRCGHTLRSKASIELGYCGMCSRELPRLGRPGELLVCPACGRTFESQHYDQIFCSPSCRHKDGNRRHMERYRADPVFRAATVARTARNVKARRARLSEVTP
jgi:predicted amidophosphoribosyltransferase